MTNHLKNYIKMNSKVEMIITPPKNRKNFGCQEGIPNQFLLNKKEGVEPVFYLQKLQFSYFLILTAYYLPTNRNGKVIY